MDTFDYIVVGAGSSGCVIANRLSENPAHRVLLIEAGGRDCHPWIHIPVTFLRILEKDRDVRLHRCASEPHLNGRKTFLLQGKVWGGGSSVNAMIYMRGAAHDYDSWARMGLTAWNYNRVLPVFRDLESNAQRHDAYHGVFGALAVCDTPFRHALSHIMVQAAQQSGLPHNPDFNGADQLGTGFYQTTIDRGRRCSSARAFLHPALKRPNLCVLSKRTCAKILIAAGRAYAVRLADGAQFSAAREIVLCAGAIGTPHLLHLSGVGPAQDLARHGVPVLVDSPGVGANLQDHFETPVRASIAAPSFLAQGRGLAILKNIARFCLRREGFFASNIVESGAFAALGGKSQPNVQMHFMPVVLNPSGRKFNPAHGVSINPYILRGFSRGRVALRSGDFRDAPQILSGMFADRRDMDLQIEAVKLALNILAAPALTKIVKRRISPQREVENDPEAMAVYVRDSSSSVLHPAGTCKMGVSGDKTAVTDQELKVRGVEGLRIGDASVMPTLISGNPNAATIMIGERCARFMLGHETVH